MSDEYLSKEEIKKWRSSVEKITLEEYAARLGKKLQEEKQTNDLADMLYTHYNPRQFDNTYNTVTKLEKIDLSPKPHSTKPKSSPKIDFDDLDNEGLDNDDLDLDTSLDIEEQTLLKKIKTEKEPPKKQTVTNNKTPGKKAEVAETQKPKGKDNKKKSETEKVKEVPKTDTKASKPTTKKTENKHTTSNKKSTKTTKSKTKTKAEEKQTLDISSLNITFEKALTDREEKVLAYFIEKRGEIVYAKDLADLLELKRDYIYKYIKNLRSKMSTDIIVNADNGGFKLD